MAKGKKTKTVVTEAPKEDVRPTETATTNPNVTFTKKNYIIMAIGVALICLGYVLMVGGASEDPNVFNAEEKYSFVRITLSPILIVGGLVLQIPGIMMRFND